jgi:hypothetical protein
MAESVHGISEKRGIELNVSLKTHQQRRNGVGIEMLSVPLNELTTIDSGYARIDDVEIECETTRAGIVTTGFA